MSSPTATPGRLELVKQKAKKIPSCLWDGHGRCSVIFVKKNLAEDDPPEQQ